MERLRIVRDPPPSYAVFTPRTCVMAMGLFFGTLMAIGILILFVVLVPIYLVMEIRGWKGPSRRPSSPEGAYFHSAQKPKLKLLK